MSRLWKILIAICAISSATSLLYAYAAAHTSPFSREHYELEQLRMDVDRLKQEVEALRNMLTPPAAAHVKP